MFFGEKCFAEKCFVEQKFPAINLSPKNSSPKQFLGGEESASLRSNMFCRSWVEIETNFVPHSVLGEAQLPRERLVSLNFNLKISANNFGKRYKNWLIRRQCPSGRKSDTASSGSVCNGCIFRFLSCLVRSRMI